MGFAWAILDATVVSTSERMDPRGYISSDYFPEKGQIYIVAFSLSLYHKYPTIGHNNISADMTINV